MHRRDLHPLAKHKVGAGEPIRRRRREGWTLVGVFLLTLLVILAPVLAVLFAGHRVGGTLLPLALDRPGLASGRCQRAGTGPPGTARSQHGGGWPASQEQAKKQGKHAYDDDTLLRGHSAPHGRGVGSGYWSIGISWLSSNERTL